MGRVRREKLICALVGPGALRAVLKASRSKALEKQALRFVRGLGVQPGRSATWCGGSRTYLQRPVTCRRRHGVEVLRAKVSGSSSRGPRKPSDGAVPDLVGSGLASRGSARATAALAMGGGPSTTHLADAASVLGTLRGNRWVCGGDGGRSARRPTTAASPSSSRLRGPALLRGRAECEASGRDALPIAFGGQWSWVAAEVQSRWRRGRDP
jgi:hypothetical protein